VVVDSETTAMAQGFVTLEAARAALQGATLHEVVERARAVIPNVEVTALLETINYAVQGGRLASAARLLGNLLRIQPLIRVAENKVSLIGQTRRRRKGLRQLLESIQARVGESPVHIAVHHAGDEAEGQALLEQLQASLDCVEAYLAWVPVALGVHAGPGAVGVACYVEGQGLRKGPGWGPNIRSQE
jgi:DegV family protein with EDD domain